MMANVKAIAKSAVQFEKMMEQKVDGSLISVGSFSSNEEDDEFCSNRNNL